MLKIKEKLKIWYDKIRDASSSHKVSGISPEHDWKILLMSTIVIIILMAVFCSYFYLLIDRGELFKVDSSKTSKEVKIDEKLLKIAVDDFKEREAMLAEIKRSGNVPPDPSI